MVIMSRVAPPVANQILPVEVIQGLVAVVGGARAIEAWLMNSNAVFMAQVIVLSSVLL